MPSDLAWHRKYYHEKPNKKAANKRFRDSQTAWFNSLKDNPCEDCGNKFPPRVMHFHHLDEKSKQFRVGYSKTSSREKILEEIEKCVLLCANCHSLRHV